MSHPHAPVSRSLPWFVLVGCAAAAVHWLLVVLLVSRQGWSPLAANVAGWLLAFGVSFCGHHRLSFRRHGLPLGVSLRRFALLSAGGFAINQASYALLLHTSGLRYELLLGAVLLGVAALTYAASRHWAFLRS